MNAIFAMFSSIASWPWHPFSAVVLLIGLLVYLRGWLRLRVSRPTLASGARLFAFVLGLSLLAMALLSPLYTASNYILSMRSLQKAMICFLAPPLLWLSCPIHVITWGMPVSVRRILTRLVRKPPVGSILKGVTRPIHVWMLYVSVFLLWHEPSSARATFESDLVHVLAIWALWVAAMLFWWHIVGTAPRIHPPLPSWVAIAYLLGAELANMFTGVYISFREAPVYAYYVSAYERIGPELGFQMMRSLQVDQIMSGATIWIVGSVVYITAIVSVLNQHFKQVGGFPPILSFSQEADLRTIAPGLEHRVRKKEFPAEPPREKYTAL